MGFKIGSGFEKLTGISLSGKSSSISTLPQTSEATAARKRLSEISEDPFPTVPLRGVAKPGELGPERTLARKTATDFATPTDISQLPEVQGIIQEATERGNLLANRLGRILQKSGNLTSTAGRDELGRAVTSVQKNLASSLAPFAESERNRRFGSISILEQLGLTEEVRDQGFRQAQFDTQFTQESTESRQTQDFLIPLLRDIIGLQPGAVINPREPGLLEQLAPLAGAAASFASDERLKEDIKTIENALEKLEKIDGKTFKYIDGAESGGVIAQEVEKVMPSLVGERNGFKTVDYNGMIGLLISAVKELAGKVAKNGSTSN